MMSMVRLSVGIVQSLGSCRVRESGRKKESGLGGGHLDAFEGSHSLLHQRCIMIMSEVPGKSMCKISFVVRHQGRRMRLPLSNCFRILSTDSNCSVSLRLRSGFFGELSYFSIAIAF